MKNSTLKVAEMRLKLESYVNTLRDEELSRATRYKYQHDIMKFITFIGGHKTIRKSDVIRYKDYLMKQHKTATVNSYLISLNRYLVWLKQEDLTVKTVRMQRKSCLDNVLSECEYKKLLQVCERANNERDYLMLRTLAATGIRVCELPYITYEAVVKGEVDVHAKGRSRTVFIPPVLASRLQAFCHKHAISSGSVFLGSGQRGCLHPSSVWKVLKRLAFKAGVAPEKVYPHSFRHLFAKTYMHKIGNIFELADLLGHSSIETTRLYTLTTTREKRKTVNMLNL